MGRSKCNACGAPVDVAEVQGMEGERVVLETATDASSDTDRYKVVAMNPLTVVKIAPGVAGDYLPLHSFDCPAGNAGHRAQRLGR
jgi:hypothetical protein